MAESEEGGASNAVRNGIAAAGTCGCLMLPFVLLGGVVVVIVFGGLGVLLAPLIALILFFGGGGGTADQGDADEVIAVFEGDGKGALAESTVSADLVDPIEEAGALCDAVGPIVIAAQIERESGFNTSMVGPDGKEGISQLPPDIFKKYGKDEDDNDKTSAFDAADSILAQGRHMCDLAGQAQQMVNAKETDDSVLDLTLAAYRVGMDAVRAAKGVPSTNEAQGYVASVRAQFAKYSGLAAPPSGATPGVTPASGTPSAPADRAAGAPPDSPVPSASSSPTA
ncbi:transglycosylase SLT domain-containing protein [Streptomyces sp. NPDC088387]|uniref:transglycosylase SLT domain-containing protein n=1 Tax=Streptomyces sp. NPDC088387 TaxID=3365859 RepID=UPI003817E074